MIDLKDLLVKDLGPCRVESPLRPLLAGRRPSYPNVDESDRVLFDDTASALSARGLPVADLPAFEPAGARRLICFDPSKTRAAIVTCGGLCPGLNDVIRALVLELSFHYGVRKIHGFRNGSQGFLAKYGRSMLDLTPESVGRINEHGGTILGTSRGQQDPAEVVDCLERLSINVLFVIGGDGTFRGALELTREIAERGARIAVVGIPKTIDNDIMFIDPSYAIRGVPANAYDSVYCIRHSHNAVHAAMSGRTEMVVGRWHGRFVHVPMATAIRERNPVDPNGDLWMSVLESTGQPREFR